MPDPGRRLRLACAQLTSTPDLDANLAAIAEQVRAARTGGADLVAFPENAPLLAPGRGMRAAAAPEASHPAVRAVSAAAREADIWVLLGSLAVDPREPDGRLANRSLLIDAAGTVVRRYDKIHMFDADPGAGERYRESEQYRAGTQAVCAPTPWGLLGMTVCYDLRFPGLYRALARAGAWFLSIPSAFTRPTGRAHWDTLVRARAIETGCWVFAPAQCGLHYGRRRTWGHAMIVDPWGRVVAAAGEEPELIFAELVPGAVVEARRMIPCLASQPPWSGPAAPDRKPGADQAGPG